MARGHLRIYLGAAPGVGKTFAMLNEGCRRHDRGTDVVIGFVEAHGRANTASQVRELDVVPRRTMAYKGTTFEEMDVDAVLARKPRVALVDEYAHTNVPGSRNEKRWRDVQELLDAGIDVITTLNIQHLESLNDALYEITGVRQQETVPDSLVRAADQIELVDMTPEAIRRRMAHGNIYKFEKVDAALANYFRPGNLAALREVALLWLADRVDEYVDRYRDAQGITRPWQTRERVVVAVTAAPSGDVLVRRAAQIAERSRGELLGVHVTTGDGLASNSAPVERQKRLLEGIGGKYHEVVGADVPTALVDFARSENATQILLGASGRSRLAELLHGSIINGVVRRAGTIDVHVIAPRKGGEDEAALPRRRPRRRRPPQLPLRRRVTGWILAALGVSLITLLLTSSRGSVSLAGDVLIYLLLVLGVAATGGMAPALAAAMAAFLCLNWYFTPPIHTWRIANTQDVVILISFLAVAAAVGGLVATAKRRSIEAERSRATAEALATVAATIVRHQDPLPELTDRLRATLRQDAVAILAQRGDGSWETVASAGPPPATPDAATAVFDLGNKQRLVLVGPPLSADDREVITPVTAQLALTLDSRHLQEEAARAAVLEEADTLRSALLNAVSHDLRTPLASIKATASTLAEPDIELAPVVRQECAETIVHEADRLNRLVSNLLDMSRIQAGAIAVLRRRVGIEEVVEAALPTVPGDGSRITLDVPDDLSRIDVDPALLERAVANLVANALAHTDGPVVVAAGTAAGDVQLRIVDKGPGIPPDDRENVFRAFQRLGDRPRGNGVGLGLAVARGFVVLCGGRLELEDTPGGGLTALVTIPLAQ